MPKTTNKRGKVVKGWVMVWKDKGWNRTCGNEDLRPGTICNVYLKKPTGGPWLNTKVVPCEIRLLTSKKK